mmetsp:Transcript_12987/g.24561  ORF Transcript_12987/g.24561 Transcript_12987/m.24561 type:complete len:179 (+) Transcript_12987:30-566(+)
MDRKSGIRGGARVRLGLWLLLSAGFLRASSTFISALPRRAALAAAAAPLAPLAPGAAQAVVIDLFSLIITKKTKCLPKIINGYKELADAGQVSDEFLDSKLYTMWQAMREYAEANRLEPNQYDPTMEKLKKEANVFRDYAKKKEFSKTMKALEKYRVDIPFGPGVFNWDDDMSKFIPE